MEPLDDDLLLTLELDPPVEVSGPVEISSLPVHPVVIPLSSFTTPLGTSLPVLIAGDGYFESLDTTLDELTADYGDCTHHHHQIHLTVVK